MEVNVANLFERREIMSAKVEVKGNKLIIELDLTPPTPSSTGKTLSVAGTHGATVTEAKIEGKPITINVNAYIRA
jgi:hypothetical protein